MQDIKIEKEVEKSSEKKRERKTKRMYYKKYNLEELYNMFDKEQNSEVLNKIMSAIIYMRGVLSNDNEETNIIKLKEEIYQVSTNEPNQARGFRCHSFNKN